MTSLAALGEDRVAPNVHGPALRGAAPLSTRRAPRRGAAPAEALGHLTARSRVLWLLLLLALCVACSPRRTPPRAVDGVLSLRDWDFASDGDLTLRGEWRAYFNQLLPPEALRAEAPAPAQLFTLPSFWDARQVNGPRFGADGVATFQLTLEAARPSVPLALRVDEMTTSYRLWVNDVLVAEKGVVSADPTVAKPGYGSVLVPLRLSAGSTTLTLQIANHYDYRGGPNAPLRLGEAQRFTRHQLLLRYLDLALVGAMLLAGAYHLGLALRRRDDPAPFWIAIMAFAWGGRGVLFGLQGRILADLAPGAPYWLFSAGDFLLAQWGVSAICLYVASAVSVPGGVSTRRALLLFTAGFNALTLLLPWSSGGLLLLVWEAFGILTIVTCLHFTGRAVLRREPGAVGVLIASVALATGGVHDILTDQGWLTWTNAATMPLAVGAFVISQALSDSFRFHAGARSLQDLTWHLRAGQLEDGAPAQGDTAAPLASRRLLVVDTDKIERLALSALLRSKGAEVVAVGSAQDALAHLSGPESAHVLLLASAEDVGTDWEFVRRVRAIKPLVELPILLLQSRQARPHDSKAFALGASDYLTRPFAPEELLARVAVHAELRLAFQRAGEKRALELELRDQRQRERAARDAAERSSLEALRYQLNPHLLFNALASIRGAIVAEPEAARDMVSHLADFCRHTLTLGGLHETELQEELALLRCYGEIQRARRPGGIELRFEADDQLANVSVPSLILQPLLENAFKHGSCDADGKLRVVVQTSLPRVGVARVRISNTGQWAHRESNPELRRGGLGLRNVSARLRQRYGETCTVTLSDTEGWVHATLDLPFEATS